MIQKHKFGEELEIFLILKNNVAIKREKERGERREGRAFVR